MKYRVVLHRLALEDLEKAPRNGSLEMHPSRRHSGLIDSKMPYSPATKKVAYRPKARVLMCMLWIGFITRPGIPWGNCYG